MRESPGKVGDGSHAGDTAEVADENLQDHFARIPDSARGACYIHVCNA